MAESPATAKRQEKCDVVVIGGGAGGAAAALALHALGAKVVVLEAGVVGGGGSSAASGLLLKGLTGSAFNLSFEYGSNVYRPLVALGTENASIVRAIADEIERATKVRTLHECTTLRSLERSAPAAGEHTILALNGIASEIAPEEKGEARIRVAGDLQLDVMDFFAGLLVVLRSKGILVLEQTRVTALDSDATHVIAHAQGVTVNATRAVLAMGAWLPSFDPWVGESARAGRAQFFATAPYRAKIEPRVISSRAEIAQRSDGVIVGVEARTIADRGDAFDWKPDKVVQQRLKYALDGMAPGATIVERGAGPRLYTCDGLPLVGPHPMRAGCVLSAGFNGLDLALGFVAGRIAAEWIVNGKPSDERALLFSPRRML